MSHSTNKSIGHLAPSLFLHVLPFPPYPPTLSAPSTHTRLLSPRCVSYSRKVFTHMISSSWKALSVSQLLIRKVEIIILPILKGCLKD